MTKWRHIIVENNGAVSFVWYVQDENSMNWKIQVACWLSEAFRSTLCSLSVWPRARPLISVDPPSLQVINAALTLAARPQSKVAQDNMDVFKDQWEKQVRILTEAVDDITSVDDFLSVSGKWNCFVLLSV